MQFSTIADQSPSPSKTLIFIISKTLKIVHLHHAFPGRGQRDGNGCRRVPVGTPGGMLSTE